MKTLISSQRTLIALAAAVLLAGGLTACGKKADEAATQVIASVDGQELTIHQMNTVLAKTPGISPENLTNAKAAILSSMVDQQLAINAAVEKKLDRSPEVVAAIEAAKRDILARATLEQLAASQPQTTDEEAKQYYADHPALFSQRRIYNLQELSFPKAPTVDENALRSLVASAKSMEDIVQWVKQQNLKYAAETGVRGAEQLPLEILPTLAALKDGQFALAIEPQRFIVMRVMSSRMEPVGEDKALPLIKTFMFNQRGAQAIKEFRAQAKSKAKIEYFGEFKGGEAALKAKAEQELKDAAAAKLAQEQKAKADAEAFAKQKAEEQAAADAAAQERSKARAEARAQSGNGESAPTEAINLEKGLKGLK